MGGSVAAESRPGEGSRFSFTLSFAKADRDSPDEPGGPDACTARFDAEALVCEDTPLNREVIEHQLRRAGLRVTLVENGAEGVRLANQRAGEGRPFDIIFMDIYMPEMDGLEAAAALRGWTPPRGTRPCGGGCTPALPPRATATGRTCKWRPTPGILPRHGGWPTP